MLNQGEGLMEPGDGSAKLLRKHQVIGEMAGALRVCLIYISDSEINKNGIQEILDRYEKEFNQDA